MEVNASGALPGPELADEAPPVARADELGRLLAHPAIWRGRSVARVATVSTGFTALDGCLPGQGWPRAGLVEVLISRVGVGEMCLLLPVLAALTQRSSARWCAWISPPFEPYAPALAAHGVKLERLFIARAESPSWAFEQSLNSGACEMVMAWAGKRAAEPSRARVGLPAAGKGRSRQTRPVPLQTRDLRRLQLAAEKGRTLGVLFRPQPAARESSSAVLRLLVQPTEQGARVTLLKSRGGHRGFLDLTWNSHEPGRSYAPKQAAKTTLFAAANAGCVGKIAAGDFSDIPAS